MLRAKFGRALYALALAVCGTIVFAAGVSAQQAISPSYSVDEAFFGTGGQLCDIGQTGGASANYCASASAGDLAAGASSSTNFGVQAGSNTNRDEYIEINVPAVNANLGIFTPGTPKTTTATFSVKTYLATSGYVVANGSDPPKSGSRTMTTLATPTAFNASNEQFGINLRANTSPVSFGADPALGTGSNPDDTAPYFSNGAVATGYNTPNQYKYLKDDIIATSNGVSSGFTTFTIAYMFNVNGATPAGEYVINHSLVATATY